jgi:hypothetical protein
LSLWAFSFAHSVDPTVGKEMPQFLLELRILSDTDKPIPIQR